MSGDRPSGLTYIPNFLTQPQAGQLMNTLIESPAWTGVTSAPTSRQVIHFGYTYGYHGEGLWPTTPIPGPLMEPLAGILDRADSPIQKPDQLIVNRYLPGQGISPHIDNARLFGETVTCLTLGSGCEIIFTRGVGEGIESYCLYVEPGSLYIMSGPSRYQWAHSIAGNKTDYVLGKRVTRGTRISLTYRTTHPDARPTIGEGPIEQ